MSSDQQTIEAAARAAHYEPTPVGPESLRLTRGEETIEVYIDSGRAIRWTYRNAATGNTVTNMDRFRDMGLDQNSDEFTVGSLIRQMSLQPEDT